MHGRSLSLALALLTVGAAPAGAATTIGSPLTQAPTATSGGCLVGARCTQVAVHANDGSADAAPVDGVVVRWRLATAGPATVRLRTVLPAAGGSAFTAVASGPDVTITGAGTHELEARLPIPAGGLLAVDGPQVGPYYGPVASGVNRQVGYATLADYGDGATAAATATGNAQLLIQADVEPDADHDGYGDETQQAADLEVSGSAPAEVGALDSWSQTYTIRNLGPQRSGPITLTVGGAAAGVVGGGCDGGATCAAGALAPGASVTVAASFIVPAIFPPPPGTLTSALTATSTTRDPVTSNNSATLSTVRDAYAGPLQPLLPPRCSNTITGTPDDDALNGTAFGDKLYGRDGKDLIHGRQGDDCAYGGNGADLVDGDGGNDTVSGGMGDDRVSGGDGNDLVQGGRGADRLSGGPGDDTLQPGPGHDRVTAGSGNDTISARDRLRDVIDCGPGKDTVRADRIDRLRHCEKVSRR